MALFLDCYCGAVGADISDSAIRMVEPHELPATGVLQLFKPGHVVQFLHIAQTTGTYLNGQVLCRFGRNGHRGNEENKENQVFHMYYLKLNVIGLNN